MAEPRIQRRTSGRSVHAVRERFRPVFFDRGIPECWGHAYRLDSDRRDPFLIAMADLRYNPTVFVTPPWKEIHKTDAERRHSYEEGIRGPSRRTDGIHRGGVFAARGTPDAYCRSSGFHTESGQVLAKDPLAPRALFQSPNGLLR